MTDLVEASRDGKLERVAELLKAGDNLHAINEALWLASMNNHIEIVKLLLRAKADVHGNNDKALRWASHKGNIEVVKLLLEAGANVHTEDDEALRLASERGHYAIVKLLLEAGANVHADNDEALRKSFIKKNTNVVKLLLDYGADKSKMIDDKDIREMIEYVPVNPRRVCLQDN